jgi:hypothetical protein
MRNLYAKKALAGVFDISSQAFDRWDESGAPFQQFLAENKLSSHMWIVARKPGAKD